jgi:hypothetical protein
MDPRATFFARMDNRLEDEQSENSDFDVDFSITESGRTITHSLAGKQVDKFNLDDMDFSVTSSGRTIEYMNLNSERSANWFSERSAGSGGSSGNIKIGDSTVKDTNTPSMSLDFASNIQSDQSSAPTAPAPDSSPQQTYSSREHALPQFPSQRIKTEEQQYQQEEQQQQRSAPVTIPKARQVVPSPAQPPSPQPQSNSAGSTGSSFLTTIMNQGAGSTFNHPLLSHTPPTHAATSYEASHFGKRARSGVSLLGRVEIKNVGLYRMLLTYISFFSLFRQFFVEHFRTSSVFDRIGGKGGD